MKNLIKTCPTVESLGYVGFSEPRNHSICADLGPDARGRNGIYPKFLLTVRGLNGQLNIKITKETQNQKRKSRV